MPNKRVRAGSLGEIFSGSDKMMTWQMALKVVVLWFTTRRFVVSIQIAGLPSTGGGGFCAVGSFLDRANWRFGYQ